MKVPLVGWIGVPAGDCRVRHPLDDSRVSVTERSGGVCGWRCCLGVSVTVGRALRIMVRCLWLKRVETFVGKGGRLDWACIENMGCS